MALGTIWKAACRARWIGVVVSLIVLGAAGRADAALVYVNQSGSIVVAHNDGGGARAVARGRYPIVSPNGRYVAFLSGVGRGPTVLKLVRADGGRARTLVRNAAVPADYPLVRWSVDSRYLLASGGRGAYIIDVRAGTRRAITLRGVDYGGGTFSLDGRTAIIVAVSGGGGASQTHTSLDAAATAAPTHLRVVVPDALAPLWGPRGIAYSGGEGLAFKRNLRQRRARHLGTRNVGGLPIAWSHDGKRLLTEEHVSTSIGVDGQPTVFHYQALIFELRTGRWTQLPGTFTGVDGISRDGQRVLAERDGDVISVAADGASRVLVPNGREATWTG